MIKSESLDALSEALSEAQGEFEAVGKTATNPFFRSAYSPLPEVVKAATPILKKHGLAVWQGADTDEAGEVLWTIVLHSSGQFIGSAARMLPVKNDPQAQGSAQTYQRRYQYMAALGLVADEDDDGNRASKPARQPSVPQSEKREALATEAQQKRLLDLTDELLLGPEDLAAAICAAKPKACPQFASLDGAYIWCQASLRKLPARMVGVVEGKLRTMVGQKDAVA